mmetsp:Transcript_22373/g.33054  ORF Transcript_22373/g.33054 Transcript_22373/m.33054 type:complete len:181 (+) Transcript_22373:82-624(+)
MISNRISNSLVLTTVLCVFSAGAVYWTISARKKDREEGVCDELLGEDKPILGEEEKSVTPVNDEGEGDIVSKGISGVEEEDPNAIPALLDEAAEKDVTIKTVTHSDLSLLMYKEKDVDVEIDSTAASDMTGGGLTPPSDMTGEDLSTKTRGLMGSFRKKLSKKNIQSRLKKRKDSTKNTQ